MLGAGLTVGAAGELGAGTGSEGPDEDGLGAGVELGRDVFVSAPVVVVGGTDVAGAGVVVGKPGVTVGGVDAAASSGLLGREEAGAGLGGDVCAVVFPLLSGADVSGCNVPSQVVPTLVDAEEPAEDALCPPMVTAAGELAPDRDTVIPEVCGAGLVLIVAGSIPTAWRRELGSRDAAGLGGEQAGLGGDSGARPSSFSRWVYQAQRSTKRGFN